MPRFPKKEADILALANQMLAGYMAHAADFPSIVGPALSYSKRSFEEARDAQAQARAAAQLATEEKLYALGRLKELMKDCLKKSEVDTADDVEKLAYIGWGPRTEPRPVDIPGQPVNLRITAQGQGTLRLTWDSPISGGPVINYIIERRQQPAGGGQFGPWTIVGSALNTEINLTDQPRGVQTEYRVTAVNISGESAASNTVAVVL